MTDKVALQHDAERTRVGLEAWFAQRGFAKPSVTILPGPQATGYSHETIVFDLSADGTTTKLVARVEPENVSVFPDPDLSIEYELLEAIADEPVPLPKLHGYEVSPEFLDAPFYVMEHLDGQVPPDSPPYPMGGWLYDATPDERAKIWWSGLAALTAPHLIDWPNKLEFVNGTRRLGLEGELDYWRNYISFCGEAIAPAAERAWTFLNGNQPRDTTIALCWGDSRLGNQMFRNDRCVALLDWEMACLSDPIQDLAWFIHFDDLFSEGLGVPRLEGIPSRAETVTRYEDFTGIAVNNLDYFEVFAAFRFVLILQRLGDLQIELGQQPPDSTFPTDNFATTNLEKMLNEKGIP